MASRLKLVAEGSLEVRSGHLWGKGLEGDVHLGVVGDEYSEDPNTDPELATAYGFEADIALCPRCGRTLSIKPTSGIVTAKCGNWRCPNDRAIGRGWNKESAMKDYRRDLARRAKWPTDQQ